MSLKDFIESIQQDARGEPREKEKPSDPKDVIAALKNRAWAYSSPCEFSPGDLVVPLLDSATSGKGHPHIVLEVIERPEPDFSCTDPNETTANTYGARRNMRVAGEARPGVICAFWVESYEFQRYVLPEPAPETAADLG